VAEAAALGRFLDDVRSRIAGIEILTGDASAELYRDPFALFPAPGAGPAGIRPRSAAEVQEIVRSANSFAVSLWPISRGQNLGYGGASAFDDRSVILDLSRMQRILEVNAQDSFCLVEPGVSFTDLFEHIERNDLPLWLSVPGYGLGSVVGNALERGIGNSPYGDHSAQICGLEVVLGDGALIRTGMGALPGSGMWQRQRAALGPRFDELFVQSGFGVVTKMGLWLMPAPQTSAAIEIEVEDRDSLGALIEALAELKRIGAIQDSPVIASYLTVAALRSVRSDWVPSDAPLDSTAVTRLRRALGLGWWNAKVRLYGLPELVAPALERVEKDLRPLPGCTLRISRWSRGEPLSGAHRGVPSAEGLANVGWRGESGAHIDFSVTLPLSGSEAFRHSIAVHDRLAEECLDYHSAFYLRDRHIVNVVQILFDRGDIAMCEAVDRSYRRLAAEAASRGFGVYRSPLRYRADAMARLSFGDNALLGLTRRLKTALDPNAVLSPGKDGLS
jgi:4-cresol dehydrogenase (hydroxylating)